MKISVLNEDIICNPTVIPYLNKTCTLYGTFSNINTIAYLQQSVFENNNGRTLKHCRMTRNTQFSIWKHIQQNWLNSFSWQCGITYD